MPPISGCTTRSKASRPKRRFTNDARLSSSFAAPRGVKYSAPIRRFPPAAKSGVVANGKKRVGAIRRNPSGSGTARPFRTTRTLCCAGFVEIRRSSRPSRSHSASAQGFAEMSESGPASTTKPSTCSVAMAPPTRSRASKRRISSAEFLSCAISVRRCAAARPAMPPPMTAIRLMRASPIGSAGSIAGRQELLLDHIGDHADEQRMIVGRDRAVKLDAVLVRDGFRLDIQIVKHLDVVGDESDWRDDHVLHAVARRGAERQADIRLEPRLARAAAAALVRERPAYMAEAPGRAPAAGALGREGPGYMAGARGGEPAARFDLGYVRRALGHRRWSAVRRENDRGVAASLHRDLLELVFDLIDPGLDEPRMVVPAGT